MSELKHDKVLVESNVFDILAGHQDGTMYFVESIDGRMRGWVTENVISKVDEQEKSDWELARDIVNMKLSKLEDIFGDGFDYIDVFNMKPEEVCAKINNYYNSIPKMGDIVRYMLCDGVDVIRGSIHDAIFYAEDEEAYWVLDPQKPVPIKLFKSKWVVKKLEDCKIDIAGALKSLTEKEE